MKEMVYKYWPLLLIDLLLKINHNLYEINKQLVRIMVILNDTTFG